MLNINVDGVRAGGWSAIRAALGAAVGLLAAAHMALGQQASPDSGPPASAALSEIIVTAQKREERLIDVPLSVTAVTAAQIEARGVTSLQDMQYAVPGLTMAETGPGQGRLQLDGIGTAGGSTGAPTVGQYLDEMPITAPSAGAAMDVRLLDMERVEVLHGPQATLYGESSMGGTIHYVTASPDLRNFGGSFDGGWGSVSDGGTSYHANVVVNAPLISDVLGLRVVAGYERDGGWIDSLVTGQNDINGVDFKTVRAKLLFRPSGDLSISLMYLHQEHNQDYQNFAMRDRETETGYPTFNDETDDLGNLIVTYNLGSATLVNSTGYLHRESNVATDFTAYFKPYLPLLGLPPSVVSTIVSIGYPNAGTSNALTDELRLSSNSTGPFNYLVGAYYRDYRTAFLDDTVTSPGLLPFELLDETGSTSSRSWAAFAELRYAFSSRLEALLGLRHYHDQEILTQTGTGVFDAPGTNTSNGDFQSNNPRLNISYKTSQNGLVYINVAKGFRSGLFNLGAEPPTPASAGPETLWTYELGGKQEWLDRRLSVELSGYYNKWDDIQTQGVQSGMPLGYYTNVGKASGPGVNFALSARPIPELLLSTTLGYTDMKYDTNSAQTDKGDPIDMVSKWTYSASAEYRHPLPASATLISRLDFLHTSGYQLTLRDYPTLGLGPQTEFPTDSRNVLNARLGVDFGKYQVYVFGNNLTDDNGTLYPAVGSFPEPVLAAPRTIGVDVKVDF